MKKSKNDKCLNKVMIVTDIKYMRKIMNFILDNFDKDKFEIEIFYQEDEK